VTCSKLWTEKYLAPPHKETWRPRFVYLPMLAQLERLLDFKTSFISI